MKGLLDQETFTAWCCCIVMPSWTYYSFHVPSASFNSSPCTLGSVALIPITNKQILVLEKADPLRSLFLQEPLFFQKKKRCLLICKYSAIINTILFLFDPATFDWEGWESQRHRHIYVYIINLRISWFLKATSSIVIFCKHILLTTPRFSLRQ